MLFDSIWITGKSRSGKTTRLIEQCGDWGEQLRPLLPFMIEMPQRFGNSSQSPLPSFRPMMLVFAANRDNRSHLADQIAAETQSQYPVKVTTPLAFFSEEIILFWPLLIESLNLKAQFPLRLRPETEQELATRLWSPLIPSELLQQSGLSVERMVRRTLDLFEIAAVSGTPVETIPTILEQGLMETEEAPSLYTQCCDLVLHWRQWCWQRGFLTYGIIADLYWQHLLKHSTYQQHLVSRYRAVLADDVDEYPAITRNLFEFLLDQQIPGTFTYNPEGSVRFGLGADPHYLAELQHRCQVKSLEKRPVICLEEKIGASVIELVLNTSIQYQPASNLPALVQSIQSISRADLLRQTAEAIISVVKSGLAKPQDIAIIAPGLDPIARYSLIAILNHQGIPVESLNEQRPLSSSPMIRALLTLLALVYPGLGRLVDRDAVAEMLVVLGMDGGEGHRETGEQGSQMITDVTTDQPPLPAIDPVRAGLLVDHCFYPHPERPYLQPVTVFTRWDRLGYRATQAYQGIVAWLETQKTQLEQRLVPGPVAILDRAIQKFLWKGGNLAYDQLTALRELIAIAQHYWQVDARLRLSSPQTAFSLPETVGQFIQLLRRGSIRANPFPGQPFWPEGGAVTLGTIFQYRFNHCSHPWHFWLDAGSPLWLETGDAVRFGATLFLKHWSGQRWTPDDTNAANEQRLRRILLDLLSRCSILYLCHSELAVNGQEQTGPLLPLIDLSTPYKIQSDSLQT